ncbi:MAG: DUF1906 domain-containing protein, partial [Bradyrhizobium sp.]|nr:DUF1906 domain-containing protein [Bradyrhizobium sp.]
MLLAFDTASTITPSVLDKAKADGVGVVWLYLKWATPALVRMIHGAGIAVGLVWETTAQRALLGSTAGSEDGHAALMAASKLGYLPPNVALAFTADFDEQASQNAAVLAYGRAFTLACAPQPTAVYGNGATCRLCKVSGCATYSWLAGG